MIIFSEKDHKYTHVESGKHLQGWTSLMKNYAKEFHMEAQLECSAYRLLLGNEEYNSLLRKRFKRLFCLDPTQVSPYLRSCVLDDIAHLKNELSYEWDYSKILGSEFHKKMELLSYERGWEINPFDDMMYDVVFLIKKHDNESAAACLYDLKDGYYPELLVWDYTMDQSETPVTQIDRCWIFTDPETGIRYASVSDWKGFSLDTKIPSIGGWINMGDIKVGDTVFDGKGNPTKVEHVSEIHYNPCFKIRFDNNEELICDHEHKWVISKWRTKGRKGFCRENIEMTTEEIFEYYSNNTKKLAIEINSIKTNDANLPIDPYLLGLWLADGNRTCGTITCNRDNIWDEVHRLGYKTSVNHNRKNDKCESRTIFGIRGELSKLGVLGNKFIPDLYLRASREQRLSLLQGYMDGDGYYNDARLRYVMETTNIRQAKDIQTLVCSLGYKCSILPYKASGFGKTNVQAYQASFRMDENPFRVRNKGVKFNYNTKKNFNYIKSIEKVETVPTKCIAVESMEKTYLVGNSLIMTHNTNKNRPYESKCEKMKPPFDNIWDNTLEKYKLQAQFGGKLLETHGFTVKYCGVEHVMNYDINTLKLYLAPYDKELMNRLQESYKLGAKS